jgi:hypothetical protein
MKSELMKRLPATFRDVVDDGPEALDMVTRLLAKGEVAVVGGTLHATPGPHEWALVELDEDGVEGLFEEDDDGHSDVTSTTSSLRLVADTDLEEDEHQRWVEALSAVATDDEGLSDALDRVICEAAEVAGLRAEVERWYGWFDQLRIAFELDSACDSLPAAIEHINARHAAQLARLQAACCDENENDG